MEHETESEEVIGTAAAATPPPTADIDIDGEVQEHTTSEPTLPCEFICGVAGSGKTYSIRERIAADPSWGLLCATTGIAAINLSAVTLNSTLKFFDTASLRDTYLNGSLIRRLRDIRESHRRLVIDEVSMMDGDQLSILVRGMLEANTFLSPKQAPPLGLTLVGDFAQLPPVKAKWAFESDEWWRFDGAATTRLTKVWRQNAGPFLDALNAARAGDGPRSAAILSSEGLEWHPALDIHFDGTTIVPKNDAVDRYNVLSLDRLPGAAFPLPSRRWGKQRGEWKQVPDRVMLKRGAYVMLLANSYDDSGRMEYANGDCGHVIELTPAGLSVELVRNHSIVEVTKITRDVGSPDKPAGEVERGNGSWLAKPHWYAEKKRWVDGQVEFYPVRLAYASTVHKSQGLSLDRCQIDIRDRFFSAPAMAYVALSRCRTLGGLRIVGQRERFEKQCQVDRRIVPWL